MTVRKSSVFLALFLAGGLVMAVLLILHPHYRKETYQRDLLARKQLVQELGLTDLCLFTEARYTRHLSQADLHSAFQDYPLAFEHFPSGSMVPPPKHLLEN